jgi:hypothetical protein
MFHKSLDVYPRDENIDTSSETIMNDYVELFHNNTYSRFQRYYVDEIILGCYCGKEDIWKEDQKEMIVKPNKRRFIFLIILLYLLVGFLISLLQNIIGFYFGKPTAFAWTGSIKGNLITLFWWFIVPTIFWPIDVFWGIYHNII